MTDETNVRREMRERREFKIVLKTACGCVRVITEIGCYPPPILKIPLKFPIRGFESHLDFSDPDFPEREFELIEIHGNKGYYYERK